MRPSSSFLSLAFLLAGCGAGTDAQPGRWTAPRVLDGGAPDSRDVRAGGTVVAWGNPVLAGNSAGDALLGSIPCSTTQCAVVVRRFTPAAGWEPARTLSAVPSPSEGSSFLSNLQVRIDDAGNAFAAWQRDGGGGSAVQVARYEAGRGWGAPEALVTVNAPVRGGSFRLALARQGHGAIAWTEQDTPSSGSVWIREYSPQGAWSVPAAVVELDLAPNPTAGIGFFMDGLGLGAHREAIAVWGISVSSVPTPRNFAEGFFVGADGRRIRAQFGEVAQGPDPILFADGSGLRVANRYVLRPGFSIPAYYTVDPQNGWSDGTALESGFGAWAISKAADDTGLVFLSSPGTAPSEIAALPFTAAERGPLRRLAVGGSVPGGAVAATGNRSGAALWTQTGETLTSVWTGRFDLAAGWGAPERLDQLRDAPSCATDVGAGGAFAPNIVADRSGNLLAVWAEFDCTTFRTLASRYAPPATQR